MQSLIDKIDKVMGDLYQVTIYKDRWKLYFEGLWTTVLLAFLACIIGIVIGTVVSIIKYYAKDSKNILVKILGKICDVYITVIRGTPMIVQLLIAYVVLFNGGFDACVFAFGLNSGAYISEVMRAGINATDKGQEEAGRSLGLSKGSTMRFIILPQAIKNMIPALFNEFIVLLKETSVAGYVAVRDLTKVSDSLRGISYNSMPLFIAAFIYLVLVIGMTSIQKKIERRLSQSDRR